MSKVTEIPTGKRTPLYRFFEILPGILSYGMVILLVVLSAISPIAGSVYLLLIVIMSLVKAIGVAFRTVQGYKVVKKGVKVNWRKRLEDLEDPNDSYSRLKGRKSNEYQYDVHLNNLCMMAAAEEGYFPKPSQVYHAVIITMYNETLDVLTPTLESVLKTTYPKDQMILEGFLQTTEYTDKEVFAFTIAAGFSTNEQITEYSGRGVGMDVAMAISRKIFLFAKVKGTICYETCIIYYSLHHDARRCVRSDILRDRCRSRRRCCSRYRRDRCYRRRYRNRSARYRG